MYATKLGRQNVCILSRELLDPMPLILYIPLPPSSSIKTPLLTPPPFSSSQSPPKQSPHPLLPPPSIISTPRLHL